MLSQAHWLPVLRTLGTRHWSEGRLMVSRAGDLFSADGTLTDDDTSKRLAEFLAGFVSFARKG